MPGRILGVVVQRLAIERQVLELNEVYRRQIAVKDVLEPDEVFFALRRIDFDRSFLEDLIDLGIAVAGVIGPRHALLDVLRPVAALDAVRRIITVGKMLEVDIEGRVGIDALDVGRVVVALDRHVDADVAEGGSEEFCADTGWPVDRIVGKAQREPFPITTTLVAGLIKKRFRLGLVEGIEADT